MPSDHPSAQVCRSSEPSRTLSSKGSGAARLAAPTLAALDAAPAGAHVGARKTAAHAMYDMDPPLGLIAGEGVFPLLVARGARAAGRRVVCCAFAGPAWAELRGEWDA